MVYSKKSKTDLHYAVLNNNLEKVRTLVTTMSQEEICKQTKRGYTALHYTCQKRNTYYSLALIPHVSDESLGYQDIKGNTVLHILLKYRFVSDCIAIIEMLIARMSSEQLHLKNNEGRYILENCYFVIWIRYMNVDTIEILLNNMTDDEFVQQLYQGKETFLHIACRYNKLDVVKLLLPKMTTEQRDLPNNQLRTAISLTSSDEIRKLFNPMVKSAIC